VKSYNLLSALCAGITTRNKAVQVECMVALPTCVKTTVDETDSDDDLKPFFEFLLETITDPIAKVKLSVKKCLKELSLKLGGKENLFLRFQ